MGRLSDAPRRKTLQNERKKFRNEICQILCQSISNISSYPNKLEIAEVGASFDGLKNHSDTILGREFTQREKARGIFRPPLGLLVALNATETKGDQKCTLLESSYKERFHCDFIQQCLANIIPVLNIESKGRLE